MDGDNLKISLDNSASAVCKDGVIFNVIIRTHSPEQSSSIISRSPVVML